MSQINAEIELFLNQLSKKTEKDDIKKFYQTTVKALLARLKPTTAKSYISKYRKAVKLTGIELYISRDVFPYLLLPAKTSKKIQRDYSRKIDKNLEDGLICFPTNKIDYFLEKAENLLKSSRFEYLMMGLGLVTGRRNYELLGKGKFWHINDIDKALKETSELFPEVPLSDKKTILDRIEKWNLKPNEFLLFSGQAKTSKNDPEKVIPQPFVIPVFADSCTVLERFSWLRANYPQYQSMTAEEIHKATNSRLNSQTFGVKSPQNFGHDFTKENCNFKILRKTYAAIFWHLCKGKRKNKALIYRLILGHDEGSKGTFTSYDLILFED